MEIKFLKPPKPDPRPGDRRDVKRFLFFPALDWYDKYRWLETVVKSQQYVYIRGSNHKIWKTEKIIPLKEYRKLFPNAKT